MFSGRSASQHRTLSFHCERQHMRQLLFHKTCDSGESSRGARAEDDRINAAFHLFKDFFGGGFVVILRISGIIKLPGHESTGSFCSQRFGLANRARHSFFVRSASDFGAKRAHDRHLFLRKPLGDKQRDPIAAIYADQRQANAGVPCGGFNDHSAFFQPTITLRVANDSDGGAVFYAAAGIQVFEFGENIGGGRRRKPREPKHRSLSDQLGNVVGHAKARFGENAH